MEVYDTFSFQQRLDGVLDRIAAAATRAGRDPADVRLVAVSKTFPPEPIDAALRAFRIYATKPPPSGGDYNIDHSSSILMFGADGRFKGTIAYQSPAAEAVRKLRDLTAGA